MPEHTKNKTVAHTVFMIKKLPSIYKHKYDCYLASLSVSPEPRGKAVAAKG